MAEGTQGEVVSDREAIASGHDLPGLWLKKIERAKKDERSWHADASEAVAIYEAREDKEMGVPAFNILHSNIEITVPSLYNSTPIPDVRRRYGDADPVGKQVVDIIERALSYLLDSYEFDATLVEATRDAELVGRGCVRVRYNPQIVQQPGPNGEAMEAIGAQKVVCEHVIWNKWGHGPARHWDEVPWVYFEHDLTHDDLERLGLSKSRIEQLSFSDHDERKSGETEREKASTGIMKTVKAFEVWDRKSKQVLFIAEQDKERFLRVQDDPLGLEQFFPIPKQMQPLRRRDSLIPLVPYKIYQTQVGELDKVTKRINSLVGQLKVRGLIDSRMMPAFERLRHCDDGQYEPADDATVFAQGGGGLERAIAHWPLAEIVAALKELYVQREQIKQTIYEVTGLSDVLRGATDPNETLGAQQLKIQQGSTRLNQRQRMVSDMCRQLLRMKAELICNHFTVENLSAMTGLKIAPEAEQLLRSDLLRSYRIDIESDSTIRADLARTQEQMSLFLQGTAQYASAMAPILQTQPGAKAPIIEIYAGFARHFKLGKSAEDALDRMSEAARQPEEPKPSPEEQRMALEQQKIQMQAEADQNKQAADLQLAQQKAAMDMQLKQLELWVRERLAEIEIEKAQADMAMKREAMSLDQQAKVFDIQARRQMSEVDIEDRRSKAALQREREQSKVEREAE